MFFERKTKDSSVLKIILFPIGLIAIFLTVASLAGFGPALYMIGVMYFFISVMPFITFLRTRNAGFLAVTLFSIFTFLVCVSAPSAIKDKSQIDLIPLFLVGMYISLMVVAYLTFNRKLRWRGQEIFELAALPIEDTGDSFSARPRPTGQVPISKTEMIRFVDFMTKNLLAFAFREDNRVIFVLALPGKDTPYLLGLKKDYLEDTWVAIDFDGNISVNITEKDYLLFKMDLDFDQLCQSLGNLIREFLELSKNGQESQIIEKMNALRLNPFM
ncbi:hypothetical protein JR338_10620 [Chloroflexota bacterium]|nr:hypothetical protein JR338_10620 [Chloroflexota bacterium]